jgi:hypothetical protein
MSSITYNRWSAASLFGAGICYSLFWLLVISFPSFIGSQVVKESLWIPTQWIHVIGAFLALFALIGVYSFIQPRVGFLGFLGFILAFLGTVFFLVDGMFALLIFPAVVPSAPFLLETTGDLSTGTVGIAFIVFAVMNMVGNLFFLSVLLTTRRFPIPAIVLGILGTIFYNLPPGIVPTWVLSSGGVLWGISAAWMAFILWNTSDNALPTQN